MFVCGGGGDLHFPKLSINDYIFIKNVSVKNHKNVCAELLLDVICY